MRAKSSTFFITVALSVLWLLYPLSARALESAQEKDVSKEESASGGARWDLPDELQQMLSAFERFEDAARTYRYEVQLLVEWKYEERRRQLVDQYDKAIEEQEKIERQNRIEAIARFERFIQQYPDEPRFSPHAMMRLAELYFERIEDEHRSAEAQYYTRLEDLRPGARIPPPPTRDFGLPIELYERVIEFFPGYKFVDAAYYLLGYLHIQHNDFDSALAVYHVMVDLFPRSRFVPEVWMRIGEYYFDADLSLIPDALDLAIEAYQNALVFDDHYLYDKVLYKLAWTYYRVGRFEDSVRHFLDLLAHYEEVAEIEGDQFAGGDLRDEAIQYAAASFADEDWGGFERARAVLDARGNPPYEFDVLRRLGEIYFDISRHADSVRVLQYVLSRYPAHRDAPLLQERIVRAWERDRSFARAFEEQQRLVENYTEGSQWHQLHSHDREAIARADEITERSLYATAIFHFEQAQTYRSEGDSDLALREYGRASESILRYLELYPYTENLYDLEFYLADSLFWSGRFLEAANYFGKVRDSNLDVEFREPAAFGSFESYERAVALMERQGLLDIPPVLTSGEWPEGKEIEPLPIPEIFQSLIHAADAYVSLLPAREPASAMAYEAALVYYRHHHHQEARDRFATMLETWPTAEAAPFAANLIVETFLISQDWTAVEEMSETLLASEALEEAAADVIETFNQFRLGGRFRRAVERMDNDDYEGAIELFLALVEEAPDHSFADNALFNAALCYEEIMRFETALGLYERVFREYPDSDLADESLFLVAFNAQKAFDYEKAIDGYRLLVDDYPDSSQHESALYNSAILLYFLQRYGEAAREFNRFARLYPDSEDTPRLLLRAADAQEKQGNYRGAISAFNEFITRYRNDLDAAAQVVEARLQIARAYEAMGNSGRALQAYRDTVEEFERLNIPVDDPAVLFAAEAQFMIAEASFEEYDAIAISGSGRGARMQRSLAASFERKMAAAREAQTLYERVYRYPHPEYVLAAAYRRAYVLERFAQSLFEAPIPAEIQRQGEEFVWAYQDMLAEFAIPLEDQAVELYIAATERSRSMGIVNEWSRRTLESLSRYRPDEYPILKEARYRLVDRQVSPMGPAPTLRGYLDEGSDGTMLSDEDGSTRVDREGGEGESQPIEDHSSSMEAGP